ncbi:hypothetical protein chiPu_0027841, partial [Chiloscyllium punctatum]|nr:hypothetical protein [Chiloscyllium punctatum]
MPGVCASLGTCNPMKEASGRRLGERAKTVTKATPGSRGVQLCGEMGAGNLAGSRVTPGPQECGRPRSALRNGHATQFKCKQRPRSPERNKKGTLDRAGISETAIIAWEGAGG